MEFPEHKQYICNYHTVFCQEFASTGRCAAKSKPFARGSRSECFCCHFANQQRRPLIDPATGRLRYWELACDYFTEGRDCPMGEQCPFSHSREEMSYHAAKYKTRLCNERECRGQDVCCFAHGEHELRTFAQSCYSYWSVHGSPQSGPQMMKKGKWVPPPQSVQQHPDSPKHPAQVVSPIYQTKVYKNRFCASYPNIESCRRGDGCAYAHGREEIRSPLLSIDEEEQKKGALTNDFFMYRFKTFWCPIGVPHDWQSCVYAHNYQDARRSPEIGYGPKPCPNWLRKDTTLEYAQRCPQGVRCPYSHGAKEQLYHPSYFKTVTCQDWSKSSCPRGHLCAFFHTKSEQRSTHPNSKVDYDYETALPEATVQEKLQPNYMNQSFTIQGDSKDTGSQPIMDGNAGSSPYNSFYAGCGGVMVPMGTWTPTLYRAQTPTTPTTAAESDEAASAGSSNGDKEDFGQSSPMSKSPAAAQCFALPSPMLGPQQVFSPGAMPWGTGMEMGFCMGPGMMSPMMCYVQEPYCQAMTMPSNAPANTWTQPEALDDEISPPTRGDISGARTPECGYESYDEDDAPLPTYNNIIHFKDCSNQLLPLTM